MNRRPLTRATALAVLLVAVMTAAFVFVDFSSEAEPTWLETKAAPAFLNAKIRIAAPRREAPIPLTIADVDRGREIYQGACSFLSWRPAWEKWHLRKILFSSSAAVRR